MSSLPYTPRRDEVYDLTRTRRPAGLFYDVGAASGEISSQLAADGVDLGAFEPFPQNAKLFWEHLAGHTNVQLMEKAVSNRRGREVFYVESTVQDHRLTLVPCFATALPSADRDEFVGFLLN